MFAHALTVCAVCVGFALVRALRRGESRAHAHVLFVALLFAITLAAIVSTSRFVGVIALGLATVGVAMPAAIEVLARAAFARGRLRAAVWLSGARAVLMPGSGLARQQEILRGLALLEQEGVDRALSHFRGLAGDADGGELMIIHEQIVAMLFYGHRWDEGIAHYESQFHPRYAALRPALALGLLRAYGESGRIDTAALLLRALEEGPVGADPRALGFVSQARLTFLAYAGAAVPVRAATTEPRRRTLGLSPASSALLRGIALARAGESAAAADELRRVPELAGASDGRVVEASRVTVARRSVDALVLSPDIARYADGVAARLEAFLQAAPRLRVTTKSWLAPLMAAALVIVQLVQLALDKVGVGMLDLGVLTSELWDAGSRGRAFVGAWIAGQPLAAVIHAYAVLIGGRLVERVLGRGRLLALALGGSSLALVLTASLPGPNVPIGGAAFLAIAVAAGALLLLPRARTPGLLPSTRRAMAIPLALVLVAEIGGALAGVFALDVPLAGAWVAMLWAVVVIGLWPASGRLAGVLGAIGWLGLVPLAVGIAQIGREDPQAFLAARRVVVHAEGDVIVPVPSNLVACDRVVEPSLALPIERGHVDAYALRGGQLVEILTGVAPADTPLPIAIDPSLSLQLDAIATAPPRALVRRLDASEVRAFHLRRNGADVALVVERRVGKGTIALVAAPPGAWRSGATLYAQILADAHAAE